MASSQKQKILRPKTRNNVICRSNWVRKTKTSDLKISVNSYMDRTKISNQEFSAVRQMMKAVNYRVLEIKNQIRKNGLHSILFDNTNNKTDKKQILGVILDARRHFARQKNRNRRYITFSSGLNESSGTFTQSESLEGGYRNFSGFRFKKQYGIFFTLILALCFFVSCGGGKSDSKTGSLYEKCYPNETCDKGLICDTENNVCIKDPDYHGDDNNNDTDNTIENNDGDKQPINNDDSDDVIGDNDPINHNDSDDIIDDNDPINHNDSDDVIDDSDTNDNDSNENNDDDDNPSENDDSDNTNGSNGFWYGEATSLENMTQTQIEDMKRNRHEQAKKLCPYNYTQQPEQYDEDGTMYIVDKCEGDLSEPMWLENAAPKVLFDTYGVPPPETHKIISMTVDYSDTGSQSNMKIRVPGLLLDVNFVSTSCLSQGNKNTSIVEMTPSATDLSDGCVVNGENETLAIETKNTKQTRALSDNYLALCESMPNYQLDDDYNTCYTTIEEFVWLESVTHKLLPKKNNGFWYDFPVAVTSIKKDSNTNMFYMTIQVGDGSNSEHPMTVYVTLKNAKSCMDQCHGKEGCTSHIEPSQNASKGCIINGKEVKGGEVNG